MKVCGVHKLSVVLTRLLAVLVLSSFYREVNALSVVRGDVDTFSNPYAPCSRAGCNQVVGAAGCKVHRGDCCICKCGQRTPNYLIHAKECVENDEVEDCEFTTLPSEKLIAVKDMSKGGNIQFKGDVDGCSNGLKLTQWLYRLDKPEWIIGQPNNFRINTDGSIQNTWSLQWNTGLGAKYSGLILKFDLECADQYTSAGCLLVKSKGNYTLSGTSNSNRPLSVVPSDFALDTTKTKIEPTEGSEKSGTEPGENDGVNDADRGESAAETKRELEEKNNSVLAVGVSLSLVVGIGLVCILILRRSGSLWLKGRKSTEDAAYEEPVDPATARVTLNGATFHNEFYDADCVLSIGGKTAPTKKLSRLGPLPPLPMKFEESIYEEPVITRNIAYHGLVKETKESNEPIKDDQPKREEGFHPPVYNTLEPHGSDDEDDYDDSIESRNSEA